MYKVFDDLIVSSFAEGINETEQEEADDRKTVEAANREMVAILVSLIYSFSDNVLEMRNKLRTTKRMKSGQELIL